MYTVYVSRSTFMSDLRNAYRHSCVVRQVQKDAPRFQLYVNGVRHMGVPHTLGRDCLPLCTQAIMGLAMEFAHEEGRNIVAECQPPAPLVTHLHQSDGIGLFVQKTMRQRVRDDSWVGLSIQIFASALDEYICFRYAR